MIIKNEDIREVIAEIPEGHRHLRTVITLRDGTEVVLQEAAMANLVRAYISIKTHPTIKRVSLKGRKMTDAERKKGFAEWQLLEERGNE